MQIHKPQVKGLVNFPAANLTYTDSGEGGLVVKLLLTLEPRYWQACSGAENTIMYENCLTAIYLVPALLIPGGFLTKPADDGISTQPNVTKLFPNFSNPRPSVLTESHEAFIRRYTSVPLVAAITLGSTNWAGYDHANGHYWQCTEHDLTLPGRALLHSLAAAYPAGAIYLTTWLDT